ncbi:fungal-specific transcription factor [Aspergillus piperis CBS 112811]|uniref:Fungal-specific transcription factor n=1 Tax=Aspergillus piperis CBS 112811 TaxID=1448313 RepID=A0A8G1R9S0_9EURO|nr:fungal-specific transcription factor [Aspergillus piperis CBS 112811]RAH61077.1 fungal-specific transcription factor [Aspergillus piperis CBS 112811]
MKPPTILATLLTLTLTGLSVADKTCTPSFDYCSDVLLNDKGFSQSDLTDALQGTGYENQNLTNILFHSCGGCKKRGLDEQCSYRPEDMPPATSHKKAKISHSEDESRSPSPPRQQILPRNTSNVAPRSQRKRRRDESSPPRHDRNRHDSVEVYSINSDDSDPPNTPGTGINAHIARLTRLQQAVDARTGRVKTEAPIEDGIFSLQDTGPDCVPHSTIAESPAQLPSDLMDSLIATYLARDYVNWPIFDLSDFQSACEKVRDVQDLTAGSSGFHAILMMILCLSGLRYRQVDEAYLQSLFNHAQRMTNSPDWQSTPWVRVQCLFLQCKYLNATGKSKQAWALIGYTIRTMQTLGFQSQATARNGRERQQRELGRRLWHSAIILERMLALQLGLPPQVNNPLQVHLPTHLDTDYIDTVSGGTPNSSGDRPSIIEFLVACARLYTHVEDITAWESEARTRPDTCAAKKLLALDISPFLKTDALLYDWQTSLPSFLRTGETFELADDPIVRRQPLGLALSAKCPCRSNKHPHMSETDPSSSINSPILVTIVRDTSLKCAAIAATLVDLIEETEDGLLDGGPDDTWRSTGSPYWENVEYLYACGIVILAARLCPIPGVAPLKRAWTRVISLLARYEGFRAGEYTRFARLGRSTLENLAGALQRDVGDAMVMGLDGEVRARLVGRTSGGAVDSSGVGRRQSQGHSQSQSQSQSQRRNLGWVESLLVDLVGDDM